MSKKKEITAAELMAGLNANPDFVEKRSRKEEERQKRVAELRKAEQPLIKELQAAGFDVESASGLFNRKEPWNKKERIQPYIEALPILLKHLERGYPDAVRAGIARALAVGRVAWVAAGIDFNSAWGTLIRLYCREQAGTRTKEGLAAAISLIAKSEDGMLDEIIGLIRDVRHGESRILLLYTLEYSSDPRAKKALMELGTDPELGKEVQAIFRRQARRKKR